MSKHYENNKEAVKTATRLRKIAHREFIKDWKTQPCLDCGVSYPYYVMDLDHRPDTVKLANPSSLANNGWARERIIEELEKCDVVCSNCHRERTQSRLPL